MEEYFYKTADFFIDIPVRFGAERSFSLICSLNFLAKAFLNERSNVWSCSPVEGPRERSNGALLPFSTFRPTA